MEEQKLLKKRRKALNENNEAVLISVCTDLATLYLDEGRYDFAIEEYNTVANIYKKKNKLLEYAVVHRGIGEAYLGLHKFDKALHHQKIYLDMSRELKNKLEEQRALATIGHTYLSNHLENPEADKNSLDLANKFFKKSLVVSQSLNGQASKTEIADMSARLFSNLGLVQDCMGNFDQASELITKSINLCKKDGLYEQLHRGHLSLASILVKRKEFKSALQQYNLAAEAAKKVRSKPVLLSSALTSKSEVLVKLGDLQGAKIALLKAYKLKIPDVTERKTIENNLRAVASMCYNEDKLLTTDSTNYASLKTLYEKMGDAACDLRQYDKALDYYKKMLESGIKDGLDGSDLGTCYYSLAETYKDNGQFDEAVVYFEKELELCRQLKDSLNTLSKIADTKEAADAPVADVQVTYERAVELCQRDSNAHEEGRMLKRFIGYLRRQKQHSLAFQCEQDFAKLNYQSSDSDGESSENQGGSVVGGDIDLDALTDISDDSDLDQPTKPRRRTRNFQVKRNVKGETQLHTACIKGQLNVVSHLLEQGHPVNVRDNCGWLPLHEACINGHIEVVKLLLDKGAAINDRGGTQCEGITPLHDAATNGHLAIVQLLLSRGANAVAKNDEGNTVFDFLKKWRLRVQLDEESQGLYDSIVEQVSGNLKKVGHVIEKQPEEVVSLPSPSKDMRRCASFGLEDESSLSGESLDYKDVMENLRHRNACKTAPSKPTTSKRSALLSVDDGDVIDNWLEDDIGKSFKKRKTNSPRKSSSPVKSYASRNSFDEDAYLDHSSEDFQMLFDDEPSSLEPQTQSAPKTPPKRHIRKKQAKLTQFGHTRSYVEPDSTSSPGITSKTKVESSPRKQLPRTHSFDKMVPVIEPTLSVDVRINKKLYRVPVLLSQVTTNTIKWLADEAANRYARKEYMVPTLELETKNGAILADDDPISLLFPMGATQAEEVEARIVKWSVPPLVDRFKEACQDMGIAPHDVISRVLQEFSVNLDFSNRGLKGPSLSPLCKVLNRQTTLLELNLSGNFLTDECFRLLAASLASLENLNRLNLNCTNLQSDHVNTLVGSLSPDVAYNVTDLDLSDNLIGDSCFESLAVLTRRFQLKKLNLSGNKFSRALFSFSANEQTTLSLDQVEEFDVSDNGLGGAGLVRVLSWLNSSVLRYVDVSRNSVTEGFLGEVLEGWSDAGKLKVCKMSRCCVRDSELFDLLRVANCLETLDLSYNNDLTSTSLRRLLENSIQNLILYGCKNILRYFVEFSKYLDETSRDQNKGKTLKLSLPEHCQEEKESLIKLWKELYGDKAVIDLSAQFFCLSLVK